MNNNLLQEKVQLQQQAHFFKRFAAFDGGTFFNQRALRSLHLSELGVFSEDLITELDKSLNMISSALSVIKNNSASEDQQNYFKTIKTALEDMSLLTHKLKLFACTKQGYERQFDISQCIKRYSATFRRSLESCIDFDLKIEKDLFPVIGSFSLFKNVYSNLLINAEEAIQATGGVGSIKVSVKNYINDDTVYDFEGRKIIKKGVIIQVSDNGIGIPEDLLSAIFKPFCSTKESHCGLGLAVAYGIIKSHGGNIILHSQANEGTTVEVLLPKYEA